MNLETKITIYKFTPQVFTLTLFYAHFFVYSVQTLPVFCIFVTNVRQAGFPEHRTTGLNCMDFGTLVIYS